jgi:RHS repeat-associated protein
LAAVLVLLSLAVFTNEIHAQSIPAPTLSPPSDSAFVTVTPVTVSDTGSGVTVHYTTDGLNPTPGDPTIVSGSSINIGAALTLKACAFDGSGNASAVTSGTYQVTGLVDGGYYHGIAIDFTGQLWAWGYEANGRLGNGSTGTGSVLTPGHVLKTGSLNFNNAISASGGYNFSLAVDSAGNAWGFGYNANYELGNNSTASTAYAVQVLSGTGASQYLTGIDQVSAANEFSLAAGTNGSAWAWGDNTNGATGLGTATGDQKYAARILTTTGTLSNVVQVSAGNVFGAALDSSGAVWVWGSNVQGAIGTSGSATQTKALKLAWSGTAPTITNIATGWEHGVAVAWDGTDNGTVWCWGEQANGRLGNGQNATATIKTPIKVQCSSSTYLTNIVEVAAGPRHTLALDGTGAVWAWGYNATGDLGNGTTTTGTYAARVSLPEAAVSIGAGGYDDGSGTIYAYSYAIGKSGQLYAWGYDGHGELADGGTSTKDSPEPTADSVAWLDTPPVIQNPLGWSGQTIQPASITLSPSVTSGSVASISYFENSALLGTQTSGPFSWPISSLPAGSYTFSAVGTDAFGASAEAAVSIGVPLPTITGSNVVPAVSLASGSSADFRVTRNGPTAAPMTVTYTVGGSAIPGVDYSPLPGSVTIASGSTSADIYVTPTLPGSAAWEKDVSLTVTGTGYNIVNGSGDIIINNSQYVSNNTNWWYLMGTGTNTTPACYSYVVPVDFTKGYLPFTTGTGNTIGQEVYALGGFAELQPAAVSGTGTAWPSAAPWFLRLASSGTTYAIMGMNGSGNPVYSGSLAFTNPIASFGSQGGGTPLYTGQTYSFGLVSGGQNLNPAVSGTLQDLKIDVYAASSFASGTATNVQPITTQYVHLPRVGESDWSTFLSNGNQLPLTVTGSSAGVSGTFNIAVKYADSGFGEVAPSTNFPLLVTVNASSPAFYLRFSVQGAVLDPNSNWDWMAVDNPSNPSGTGDYSASFTTDFTQSPLQPWQSTIVNKPTFAGTTPIPTAYQGMSEEDLLNLAPFVTGSDSLPVMSGTLQSQYLTTGTNIATVTSPELVDNPILDSFVTSMNGDPMALANYVQNQIGLVDALALPNQSGTISYSDQSVNFGGVNRSALGVLLEGQGSPVEQCGLLVYLLRKAGVPCGYVFGPLDQTQMLTSELSPMLRMQLSGAEDFGVAESTSGPTLTPVNYPWVAAYINGQWVNLFPWIKDTVVQEGYNLYDCLPQGYNTGADWLRKYLYNDPKIRTPGTEYYNDPGVLFTQFVENNLPDTMSIDDIGVTVYNRPHYYTAWSQFPHPWSRPGVNSTNLYPDLMSYSRSAFGSDKLFDTVSIQVFSDRVGNGIYATQDPVVLSGTLYSALLDDRRFLLYHVPIASGTTAVPVNSGTTTWSNYDMILSLEAATPGATGTNVVTGGSPFTNTGGDPYLLNKQQAYTALSSSDSQLYMVINYTRHRAAESSNGSAPFLDIIDGSPAVDTRPLRIGDTAGICLNFGQVTHWMLEVQEEKYWAMQQEALQNPSATFDIETAQGLPAYLMGMDYYYRTGAFTNEYQALTGMQIVSNVAHGLSKISALRTSGTAAIVNGNLDLLYPNVDMAYDATTWAGNLTTEPGSGDADSITTANYFPVEVAAVSAQEQLTIQQFFSSENENAVATVSLMDVARGLTLSGTNFIYPSGSAGPSISATSYTASTSSGMQTVTVSGTGITVSSGTTTLCVTGSGGMIELNSENYQALGQLSITATTQNGLRETQPLSTWAGSLWTSASNAFTYNALTNTNPQAHVVFITPGPISGATSTSGTTAQSAYYGMAALIYGDEDAAALISPNWNGAFAGELSSMLPDDDTDFVSTYLSIAANSDDYSIDDNSGGGLALGTTPTGSSGGITINAPQEISTLQYSEAANAIAGASQGSIYVDPITQGGLSQGEDLLYEPNNNEITSAGVFITTQAAVTESGVMKTEDVNVLQTVADPVNTVTGEFYNDHVDLKLNGPMPLEIGRNYQSQNILSGAFGYGWKMSMVPYLVVTTDSNQTLIYAAEMDGSVLTYRRQTSPSTRWIPESTDNPSYIVPTSTNPGAPNLMNNRIDVATSGTTSTYTLTGADGSVRTFVVQSFVTSGTNGLNITRPFLQKWQDNKGNYLTFSYGTDPTQVNFSQLTSIQSSNGNYANLTYDTYGHITQAFTGDGSWTYYQYDDYCDLTQVTLPDNSVITYAYRHQPNPNGQGYYSEHLLTQINKPGGRVLQNYYDYFGFRRVLFQKSTIQQGNAAPVQSASFNYVINGLTSGTPFVLSGTTFNTGTTLTLSGASGYGSSLSTGSVALTSSTLLSGSIPLPGSMLTNGVTTLTDVNNNSWIYTFANGNYTQISSPPQNTLPGSTGGASPLVTTQTWYSPSVTPGGGAYPCALESSTDARGLATVYQYDTEGNLTQKTVTGDLKGDGNNSETATTSYSYNSTGTVTLPGTSITTIPNTIASVTDPLGNSVSYLYGNSSYPYLPTSITKATPSGTVRTDLLQYENASTGSVTSYGLLQQETDASGSSYPSETQYVYGGNGFPTQKTQFSETSDPNVVTNYTYNLRGQMTSATDSAGRSTQYQYDALGNQTGVLRYDQNGSLTAWQFSYYNQNGEIEWTQGPAYAPDDYVQTEYDGAGRRSMVSKWLTTPYSDGSGIASNGVANTFYSYDLFGDMTSITDPRGNVTSMTYDAIGEMLTRQTPNGSNSANEAFTYEPGGKVATHTTVLGGSESFAYTTNGLLMSGTLADGSTEAYNYDLDGRVVYQTLANGSYWTKTYNDTSCSVTSSFYNSSGVLQGTVVQQFDPKGNLISATDIAGYTTTTSYDGLNRVKSVTGPPGSSPSGAGSTAQESTYTSYDAAGITQTGSNALGEQTVTTFDSLERPTKVVVYNADGTVATTSSNVYAPNFQSVTSYEGSGTNGVVVANTVYTDTFGKPILVKHGDGTFQLTGYDANENKTVSIDEVGNVTTWTYDALNHLSSETLPSSGGSAGAVINFTYNAAGELLSRAMPGGLTAETVYDSAGRKTHEELDGAGGAVTRGYGYTYYPSNSGTGAAAGLLETGSDPRGFTVTTTYDAWMRPSSVASSGAAIAQQNQATTYGYDIRGMVNSVAQSYVSGTAGPSTLVTRGYDGYGHINAESVSVSGTTVSQWDQSWDAAGRRSALNWQLPAQGGGYGSQYWYGYNAACLLTDVNNTGINYGFTYGDDGLLKQRSSVLSTQNITARDACGRITAENSILYGGTTAFSETAAWRGDSRMSQYSVTGALVAGGTSTETHNYSYDGRGRVTTEPYWMINSPDPTDLPNGPETSSYQFDSNTGNGLGVRTLQSVNVSTGDQVTGTDSFQRPTEEAYATGTAVGATWNLGYDAQGNVTSRTILSGTTTVEAQTLTWDAWGRLVGVTLADTGTSDYNCTTVYDGLGRRVQTNWQPMDNGVNYGASSYLQYYYDPQVEFLELGFNDNGTRTWKVYGPDNNGVYGGQQGCGGLESEVNESASFTYVPLNNQFGDDLGITYFSSLVGSGSCTFYTCEVALGGYGPEPGTFMSSLSTNLGAEWRGHYADWTGFVSMGARYYELRSGRFLSPDPLGNGASMSLYDYCAGDPVNGLDPDGRCVEAQKEDDAQASYYNQLAFENQNGREDVYQNYQNLANQAQNAAIDMGNRAYILSAADQSDYRSMVVNQYGINNPNLNNIMSFYANYYNDQDTLNYLAAQNPAAPPTLDANSVALMLLLPEAGLGNTSTPDSPASVPQPEPTITAADSAAPTFSETVAGSGGRLGSTSTRAFNANLAEQLQGQGYTITGGGGGMLPEEYIPGTGGGTSGSTYVDITAGNGTNVIRIQTIDTLSDGVTPTLRESAAAARIRTAFPNDTLILIPKPN